MPMLGAGHEWFDTMYRFSRPLLDSDSRIIPRKARKLAAIACSNAEVFRKVHYENKGDWPYPDPQYVVPAGIHVSVLGLWVSEVFTPSMTSALVSALRAWKWSNASERRREEVLRVVLQNHSASQEMMCVHLDNVASIDVNTFAPEYSRGKLPEPFISVNLSLFRLEDSLTVVCAAFSIRETWTEKLDEAWHSNPHAVAHRKSGFSWEVSDRHSELSKATRFIQDIMYDQACKWMYEYFRGAFAHSATRNPTIQLALFDGAGADGLLSLENDYTKSSFRDVARLTYALGIDAYNKMTCPGFDKLEIRRRWHIFESDEPCENCYVLCGIANEAHEEYGQEMASVGSPDLFTYLSDTIEEILLKLTLLSYVDLSARQYTTFRNSANVRFGRYSAKQVDEIRQFVLETSLDNREVLEVIERAIIHLEKKLPLCLEPTVESGRENDEDEVVVLAAEKQSGRLYGQVKNKCDDIKRMDGEYRDAITDIVSLGTDRKALDVARAANYIALVALVLSIPTCSCGGGNTESSSSLAVAMLCKLLELLKPFFETICQGHWPAS